MKIVERPQGLPGCDFLTRTDVGPFVDLDAQTYDIPQGNLYLAQTTVEEMAGLFGMMSVRTALAKDEKVSVLEAENKDLASRLAAAEAAVVALTAYVGPAASDKGKAKS